MKTRTLAALLLSAPVLVAFALALAQTELPPGPKPVHRASFTPADAPEAFDVVSLVLVFEPGAWTPLHSHAGQGVVLVLEGEMTTRDEEGNEATFGVGETWDEAAGHRHMAGNETGADARVLFTALLPEGEDLTTVYEE